MSRTRICQLVASLPAGLSVFPYPGNEIPRPSLNPDLLGCPWQLGADGDQTTVRAAPQHATPAILSVPVGTRAPAN